MENFTELRNFDLIIAGGGAAGIMAAGIAAQAGFSVLVCEKMEKPQRKVRITGKGRCNLTNMRRPEEFLQKVRSSSDFFAPALARFGNRETVSFFERIGVPLTIERGERVFPASGRAWDIADAHVRWSREQGAQIVCHTRVTEVHTAGGRVSGVTLSTARNDSERVTASCVLLATGGASYPATGSTGDGYLLAHRLGVDDRDDEALGRMLDAGVEIRAALARLSGVTKIIIAQRIGSVESADKIIVLDDGKIIGMGTHEELMKNCEVYRQIAMSQLSEEELA